MFVSVVIGNALVRAWCHSETFVCPGHPLLIPAAPQDNLSGFLGSRVSSGCCLLFLAVQKQVLCCYCLTQKAGEVLGWCHIWFIAPLCGQAASLGASWGWGMLGCSFGALPGSLVSSELWSWCLWISQCTLEPLPVTSHFHFAFKWFTQTQLWSSDSAFWHTRVSQALQR